MGVKQDYNRSVFRNFSILCAKWDVTTMSLHANERISSKDVTPFWSGSERFASENTQSFRKIELA